MLFTRSPFHKDFWGKSLASTNNCKPPPLPVALGAVRSKAVGMLLLINCCSHYFVCVCLGGGGGFDPCFAVQFLVSYLVLQSSRWGRELVTLL